MIYRLTREDTQTEEYENEITRLRALILELEQKNEQHIASISSLQDHLESSEQSRVWSASQYVNSALYTQELEESVAELKAELVRYSEQLVDLKEQLALKERAVDQTA